MKQFTFSHFLVDEGNRDAFDMARRVADLEPIDQQPVVLLGEDGCGKTHLLYAIVNRLRAASSRTGLAYVTAHDFPEQVRRLIHDPGDVERAQSAVLLVDQFEKVDTLERDSDLLEELEAVIRIFLDNGHYVIVASAVHPERLRNVTDGLREQIARAQIVPMHSQDPAKRAEIIEQQVRRELAEMLENQRQEIETLKAAAPSAPHSGEREELERQLDVAKAFGESLQRDLQSVREELAQVRSVAVPDNDAGAELAAVTAEAATLRDERDALREELGRLHDVVGELEHADAEKKEILREAELYRQQARASREEYELSRQQVLKHEAQMKLLEADIAGFKAAEATHEHERAQLDEARSALERHHGVVEEKSALEKRVAELEHELDKARVENDAAREEAGRLLERAEGLLAMVEMNRARFAEVEASQKQQIEELERLIAERTAEAVRAEELEAAKAQALAALEQIEQQRAAYDDRIGELETTLESSKAEADGIRDAHDRTVAERDQLRAEMETECNRIREDAERERSNAAANWDRERNALRAELESVRGEASGLALDRDRVRGQLGELERELDALRHEAAQQVAAAHAQAGELEGRLSRMEIAFEQMRRAADKVSSDLLDFATEMRNGAGELVDVAERLSTHAEAPMERSDAESEPQNDGGASVSVDERAGLLDVVPEVESTANGETESETGFDDFPSGGEPRNGHDEGHDDGMPDDTNGAMEPEMHDGLDEAHVPGGPDDDFSDPHTGV